MSVMECYESSLDIHGSYNGYCSSHGCIHGSFKYVYSMGTIKYGSCDGFFLIMGTIYR
jgi:hypothetical protein